MTRELRRALQNQELRLHYQPDVDLESGEVLGAEALLRWAHPTHGLVTAADFLPMAESNALIAPIGAWVLDRACHQLARWRGANPSFRMTVNLSARQLADPELPSVVSRVMAAAGVEGRSLCVDVSEDAVGRDPARAVAALEPLRGMGVGVGLDDFGVGSLSREWLKQLPLDVLKVDAALVAGLGRSSWEESMVAAGVGLAKDLGVPALGEGVQAGGQQARLRALGCSFGQGHLYGRPQEGAALDDVLGRWRRSSANATAGSSPSA